METTKSEFWTGWESALDAVDASLSVLMTLGYDHHNKCTDVLLDVHNNIKDLKKLATEQEVDNFLLGSYNVQEDTEAQDTSVN